MARSEDVEDLFPYDYQYMDPEWEEERWIAATSARPGNGPGQRGGTPYGVRSRPQYAFDMWSVPPHVWAKFTPEEQNTLKAFREAARVRNTTSGTPRFQVDAKGKQSNMEARIGANGVDQKAQGESNNSLRKESMRMSLPLVNQRT